MVRQLSGAPPSLSGVAHGMKEAPAAAVIYSNLSAVYETLGKQECACATES